MSKTKKEQESSSLFWKLLFVGAFIVKAHSVLADDHSCTNQIEVPLNGQAKMSFCEIPSGQKALVGSLNGPENERPLKGRNFKKFHMGRFEVTQLQYKTVMKSQPWQAVLTGKVREGDSYPAVYVSYYDAQRFALRLNTMDPTASYRLPTEAEFEYAARAGTATNYFWGDKMDDRFAYFSESSGAHEVHSCPNDTQELRLCANGLGLYHMLGNVWEWTADSYQDNYDDATVDGHFAFDDVFAPLKVIRGGAWHSTERELRSAHRIGSFPAYGRADVGFRLLRIAK